jgi:hypothetical protein
MDKIGVVIPTCNKDRKQFLSFLLNRLQRQSRNADSINVVGYPNIKNINDLYERYLHGITELIYEGCNFIIFMEDDDYYPLTYIKDIYDKWIERNRPIIVGNSPTRYYHILNNTYRIYPDLAWCSAHCTAVSSLVKLNFPHGDKIEFDKKLWEYNTGEKICMDRFMVSIKHGIGMTAGRIHQTKNMKPDHDMRVLKSWVDKEAFDFYMEIKRKYK